MIDGQTAPIEVALVLEGEPGDARRCRVVLADRLGARLPEVLLEDVLLVASELVANGVRHSDGRLVFRLAMGEDDLLVAVDDRSPEGDVRVNPLDPAAASGRGMWIVDQVADGWGVEPLREGKRVWARFDLGARAPV